ncbi:MAG: hypothetical protein AUH82_00715 [Chloroflexi bacterium 13_1_40CM_4_65_13]|nr:MAG: hypothetical protein AUH82_00715 [Chloroflexi bacterium 13_1_40CM_4_65_13]
MSDREVILSFVSFLAANGHPGLKVDGWPEDHKHAEIDAVAGDFAIEHTSIDTLPDQRRDAAWYEQVVGNLDKEMSPRPAKTLFIVLRYDAVQIGQDWRSIREALKRWLQTDGQLLADGRREVRIEGVPFPVDVSQWSVPARIPPSLFFGRYTREDATLPQRIRALCDRKIQKLAAWKARGKTTVLLLENDDLALMNHIKFSDALRDAYPGGRPAGVDQLWYVSTAIQPTLQFLDLSRMWEIEPGVPTMWPPEP